MKRIKTIGKIFVLLAVLLVSVNSLWAGFTTAHHAELAVSGWLKADSTPLETTLGSQVAQVDTYTDDDGQPIYHIVYLEPSGFVIVSADDKVEPIIGFVKKGTYDPSPHNPLRALVSLDLKDRVASVRDIQQPMLTAMTEQASAAQNKWNQLIQSAGNGDSGDDGDSGGDVGTTGIGSVDDVRIAPLVQSEWNQRTACGSFWCYAYYTPNHWYCGCTATALAQIMRYHEYPDTGIGKTTFDIKIDGSVTQRDTRGGDGNGGVYDWANMVLIPDCDDFPEVERQAIGALCHDAGVGISDLRPNDDEYTHYNYSGDVTIAFTYSATLGLKSTFKYANAIMGNNYPNSIPQTNLNKMINPNLDGGYPVFLGIRQSDGPYGHAVVCDGYGYNLGTMYHHVNVGWGGDDNAWYNLPTVDTTPRTYNQTYETIYNIRPTAVEDGEMISGRVFDNNGDPIDSPLVYAEPSGQAYWIPNSKSWSNGIYAFDDLQSNKTYSVCPLVTGYAFTSQNVSTTTSTMNTTTVGNIWGIDFYGELLEITNITPASGPIGSYIKIEGQNFHTIPGTVVFSHASVPGGQTNWSDTVVYCRVPDGAWSGNVHIYTHDDQNSSSMYFEVTTPSTVYVDDDAGEVENGTAEYPFSSIQLAIDAVVASTVIVNPGTYYENINFNGKNITVTSIDPANQAIVASTIIDGGKNDCTVRFENGEDSDCLLTGFTITNGDSEFDGGGIYCELSSPTISYCTITGNSTENDGGGIRCFEQASPTISYCTITGNSATESRSGGGICLINDSDAVFGNCTISNNTTGYGGGGMYNNRSNPTLIDCTFSNNSLTDEYTYGGGINNYESSPTLINCTFIGNDASCQGGGIYHNCWDPQTLTLINCIFIDNSAGQSGGGLANINRPANLTNCLFIANSATSFGGGAIYNTYTRAAGTVTNCTFSGNSGAGGSGVLRNDEADVTMTNCILWENGASQGDEISDGFASATTINYSDVQGGWTGAGTENINADPLFVDPDNADLTLRNYWLMSGSPCIDEGSNAALPSDSQDLDSDTDTGEDIPWDLDSNPRLVDSDCDETATVDMGVYEFAYVGDLDFNCSVDLIDFGMFAPHWLETGCNSSAANNWCGRADINHLDGVNLDDLTLFAGNWLAGK